MDRIAEIRQRLENALNPETLQILDDSAEHAGHVGAAGGGGHYTVRIVATKFSGQSLVTRHRMVYEAVNDLMPTVIHALSIRALSPEER